MTNSVLAGRRDILIYFADFTDSTYPSENGARSVKSVSISITYPKIIPYYYAA